MSAVWVLVLGAVIAAGGETEICLRAGDVVGLDQQEMGRIRADLVALAGTLGHGARTISGEQQCPDRTVQFSLMRAGGILQVAVSAQGPGGSAEESWTVEADSFPGPRMAKILVRLWPRGAKVVESSPPLVAEQPAPAVEQTAPVVVEAEPPPPDVDQAVSIADAPTSVVPWGPVALGGAALVAGGVGTWYGLDARNQLSEADARGPGSQTHIEPGRTARTRANVAWAVAGTAVISAALWWWLGSESDSTPTP